MSSDAGFNPYTAPEPIQPQLKLPPAGRPGWFTFYCVMAIVLGALGAMSGLTGAAGAVAGVYMQQSIPIDPNLPQNLQEMHEIQNEMNAELRAATGHYIAPLIIANVLLLFVGSGLVVGGLWALQQARRGVNLLGNMFMITSVFDTGRLVLSILILMANSQVTQKHMGPLMEKAVQQQPGRAAPPAFFGDCMTNSVAALFGVSMFFMVAWLAFKLWLYLSGWVYFRKPEIQAILHD
jgi:hypothetical protein